MERAFSGRGTSPAITWTLESGYIGWATALHRTSRTRDSVDGVASAAAVPTRPGSADAASIIRWAPRDLGSPLARHLRRQAGRVHPLWLVIGALLLFVACGGLGSSGGRSAGHGVGVHHGTHHRHHGHGRRSGDARGVRDGGLLALRWTASGEVLAGDVSVRPEQAGEDWRG